MPGTVSANSRKLRVICGTVSICCSDTVPPTSEVRVSTMRLDLTVISLSVPVTASAPPVRSTVAVEATVRVTVVSVPGPASTRYVPGCKPGKA